MAFTIKSLSDNTLKANFSLMMAAFAFATISICTITIIAANTTSKAILKQETLLERYHLAYDISGAVQELLYRSADLSNSLSDSALDAFLDAQARLDSLSLELDDPVLVDFIQTSTLKVTSTSMAALDSYIKNDRSAGDAQMQIVRASSHTLQTRVLAHQSERLEALDAIQKKTLAVNNLTSKITALFTILAVFASGALMLVIYKNTIRPIQTFIATLKDAVASPGKAKKIKFKKNIRGEIGEAVTALNSLLEATQNALESARSQAESAKHSEARWKAIFNLSPDAIILLNQDTAKIADCNPATINMLNLEGKDFTQLSAFDFHAHEMDALEAFMAEIHTNGHARADNLSCKLDNDYIPVSVVGVDVTGENGKATMLYIRDMSEIIAQQDKLKKAQHDAEQANEAKSAFLATMSHEIRTPLNGMLGMAQALEASELSPADTEKVETIIDSGDMLMTLLNDVLDISKIGASKMELSRVPTNLAELVTQTHKLFSAQAEDKGLAFTMSISPDLPEILDIDPVRVRQCLTNLVSNALKFTNEGKVHIEAFTSNVSAENHTIGLRVSDTGIGMDDQTCQNIFSPFIQADSSISRKFGGTGLGLSISHELALMMDGDIAVESSPEKGSTFTLTFKAKFKKLDPAPKPKNAAKIAKTSLSGRRVLLVDDSATNRKVIRTLLSATGISITEAEDGQQALDLLNAEPFDLILLDMHMPVLNGPDTIAHIRACGEKWSDIPVLAVTADVMIANKERYKSMGLDGYIAKPVDQRLLFVGTFKALGKQRGNNASAIKAA